MVSYIMIHYCLCVLCYLGFLNFLSFLCCFPAKWGCQVSSSSFDSDDALSSLFLMFLMFLRFLKFLKFLMFLIFAFQPNGYAKFLPRLAIPMMPCSHFSYVSHVPCLSCFCFPAEWVCQVSPSFFDSVHTFSSLFLMFLMFHRFLKFLKFLMFLIFAFQPNGYTKFLPRLWIPITPCHHCF